MDDPRARQAAINATSRGQWEGFAGHREQVSALLGAGNDAATGRGRLCVLGVGNGNDLDLPALLATYREVHLVDLDPPALGDGVRRQGVADHPALRLHGGIDVTAMLDAVSTWSPGTAIGRADLEALAGWPAGRVPLALPGPFDRVASTCLLSQLIDTASHALGGEHPRIDAVMAAIRAGHLRLLAGLATPGGAATLITDVVNSERFPPLADAPGDRLADLLPLLARSGIHMLGLHPRQLAAALRDDPELSPRLTGLETVRPWAWRLHARRYLVWAMTFRVAPGRPR